VLEGIHEDLVVEHALVVSFLLLLDLLEEELFLDEGVIEFGVGVAELVVLDEEFEPFGESGFGAVVLGQGRHELRVLDDEGGVEALVLGLEQSTLCFLHWTSKKISASFDSRSLGRGSPSYFSSSSIMEILRQGGVKSISSTFSG